MRAKDFKESWERGQQLETEFFQLVLIRDPNARAATTQEQFRHIDFVTSFGTIDVKSKKRIGRHQGEPQSEWVWLEYKNVQGKNGWLVSEVDILAFERDDDFLVVFRKDVKLLADELCNLNETVDNKKYALYKGYTRKGRKDLITLVSMADLMRLNYKLWSKL